MEHWTEPSHSGRIGSGLGYLQKKCLQEGGDKSKWQLSGRLCSVHKESVVTQVGTHKEGKKKVHVWYYHGTKCHLEVTRYITP